MKSEPSVKKNTIYNIIKSMSSVVFPLVTFPYVSRVLGTENVGKINFSTSVISYISLIASLGITTYAVRECAKIRENKKDLNKLASQIFTINVLSTIFAFLVLLILLIIVKPLFNYRVLILINASTVLFTLLGTDWINTAMEDFKYITIRTFAFQLVSILLMFIFVRESEHYYRYAFITALSASGGNITNIFYRRKYCKISLVKEIEFKKHIKPILLVFSLILSQTIYCNSDVIILGLIKGDYQVGLYSVAVRIYTIVNTLVASVAFVVMPRMSNAFSRKDYLEINGLVRYAMDCVVVIGVPILVGIACIAPEVVEIIAGKEYAGAELALRILMISLMCSFFGGIVTNVILIPSGREKICLFASIVSACVNIILNFILIPKFGLYAAAATTALAEAVGLIIVSRKVEKKIRIDSYKDVFGGPILGCIGIALVTFLTKKLSFGLWLRTLIIVVSSVIIYVLALLLCKNKFIKEIIESITKKIKR